nr:hypothetical protein GCM10020185_50110 [Pseudomonas brassicacearum subsp. brassicacearum]
MGKIATEAEQRWPLLKLEVLHRIGALEPGEPIVFVGAASAHRQAAFDACAFVMDYLKTRAPFWKKRKTLSMARAGLKGGTVIMRRRIAGSSKQPVVFSQAISRHREQARSHSGSSLYTRSLVGASLLAMRPSTSHHIPLPTD